MIEVSLITTCKGRFSHLIDTLDFMVAQQGEKHEVVVVDYGDPDGAWDYVTTKLLAKNVAAVKVMEDVDTFNLDRARNFGAKWAQGDILAFVDSDVFIYAEWLTEVVSAIRSGYDLVTRDGNKEGITGTFAVTRKAFDKVNGFDESLHGWGHDEIDFFRRCTKVGSRCTYSAKKVHAITHTDELRTAYYEEKDKKRSQFLNIATSRDVNRKVNPNGYAVGEAVYYRYPDTRT